MITYQFPDKALVNRNIPKTKFYEHASISRSLKDAFVSQIQQITWAYKLSPETTNLAAVKGLFEIQVFNIQLKTPDLDNGVLLSIDKAIPHPIFYQLFFEDKIRVVLAYKRLNEADETKWVIEQYLSSTWMTQAEVEQLKTPLPISLNLGGLYEQMLKALMPIAANVGEGIKAQTDRLSQITQKQKEIAQLQSKMRNEKQFNRKVEMNNQLKTLQQQLEQLQA
ncbi:MAG: DUF4391 domain-containing protein [Betaproteobacteria bacterium HGW-Betaproteobacteria-22]|nr:MAG: DUF4391 domain-containing protein [Betaproteobacteria bacterium HGW-Betaproteobacteria-22]